MMMSIREEGPVYYREIQKNAYLKRIPNEPSGKLRPLGHKKPPLKPMWTLFCVHNGRTPFLEQYPAPEAPATLAHRPAWRASLRSARHVTASVKPHTGEEYDFLVDTDQGPVRMLAPDWDSMQDWVSTLRSKLHELKILSKGENVYMAPPAAPAPRAGTRDPTSPLPPTPPVPPDRVPGIELATPSRALEPQPQPTPDPPDPEPTPEPIDISNWEDPSTSTPSTSQDIPKTTKICGQNICFDSVLRREATDSDEEFFNEIDRISEEVEAAEEVVEEHKQRMVVEATAEAPTSDYQSTNITVIQVSNKEPPHTAIPVLGPETDVFNFDLEQLSIEPKENFINIVNTESNQNGYGTVYRDSENDYGHISLTTTVSLTGEKGIYERLCQASTSTERSPLPIKRMRALEKVRKSSLPNMDFEETYEYLYPGNSNSNTNSNTIQVNSVNGEPSREVTVTVNVEAEVTPVRAVERSSSQNACDREIRLQSPKRERNDKPEVNNGKPIWRRGLTELSLLSRLRGLGTTRRHDSPTRHDDRSATVPVKVVRRSRPEGRVDSGRRRSSSLSNEPSPPSGLPPGLRPLRQRQAAALRAEQRRGAAAANTFPAAAPPVFVDYNRAVWIAWWGRGGAWCGGRCGDRVAALRGTPPRDARHARSLVTEARSPQVDILFHRVPLGKIYVLSKRDHETLGIKLDNECSITAVEALSPAARAALPPPGRWAVTEVNNRPLNLVKGSEEEMNRIGAHGTEVSVLIQPAALVKKIRSAIKANKTLLGLR